MTKISKSKQRKSTSKASKKKLKNYRKEIHDERHTAGKKLYLLGTEPETSSAKKQGLHHAPTMRPRDVGTCGS
jgi:hypothetical protein